ncbi:3-keto-disaccharide hydrolase [Flavivirga spongiicola]|uniref:DUF1080 domain-containing protein n=1 Tax=Flavivirga spongiicola TaxID=421621 RepID=A0ABU7XVU5_9FLAO|nr:DUF1080 domain-containing protein [Flavivirga sp. MEBiC05379]MDO5979535.1 DUF1080 domain-containing protein [Flavivirga sp. MEBiC05379]
MKYLKLMPIKPLIYLLIMLMVTTSCKLRKGKTSIEERKVDVAEKKMTEEWVTLFDGSSFNNWRGYLSDKMPSEWSIEDGTMAFTPGEHGGKNIITKEKYTNFVLSLEWKISELGNSGIFWSVFEDEAFPEAYQTGPEIQVLDNKKYADAEVNHKHHQAGALYDMVPPAHDVCKPAGEWNTCLIKVDHKSNSGSVTLNGTVIAEFAVHGSTWDALVAKSKFKDWKGFGKHQTGHIGLQDHGNKVWFRNIKIKKL